MKLYKCGERVKLLLANMDGVISGISIRYEYIQYEVSYFYNGAYNVVWVTENEFILHSEKIEIGFKK